MDPNIIWIAKCDLDAFLSIWMESKYYLGSEYSFGIQILIWIANIYLDPVRERRIPKLYLESQLIRFIRNPGSFGSKYLDPN